MQERSARSYVLGRGKDCDVDLADGSVSRQHATLRRGDNGTSQLSDFPSRLGTFVFRENAWRKIDTAVVGHDEPVMFGEYRTTLARIVSQIDRRAKGATTDGQEIGETRRTVSVLIADVVGYSRWMSQDPQGTLGAMKAARRDIVDPFILLQGGRIFGEAGDSVCAEFDDAAGAVRAATAVQVEMGGRSFGPEERRLKLRIGIHGGEVIVRSENLFGSPVNIAARLQTLATPGRICISAHIRKQLGEDSSLVIADLGEKELKNIPEPMRVFEIAPEPAVGARD